MDRPQRQRTRIPGKGVRIAPTTILTPRRTSRPSNIDRSSQIVSAPLKTAAASAGGSSVGTTTTTVILALGSTLGRRPLPTGRKHPTRARACPAERLCRSPRALRSPPTCPTAASRHSLDQYAHGGRAHSVISQPTGLTRVDRFRARHAGATGGTRAGVGRRLGVPDRMHDWLHRLTGRATLPAVFGAGILVGLCTVPCSGAISVLRWRSSFAAHQCCNMPGVRGRFLQRRLSVSSGPLREAIVGSEQTTPD